MTNKERYNKWYYANHEENKKKKRESMKRRREAEPEKYATHSRESKRKLKEQLFNMYGHKCILCGFDDKRTLTLDHINNNGSEERKQLGERGVYRRARDNYLPSEYRILCMNCQFIERYKNGKYN